MNVYEWTWIESLKEKRKKCFERVKKKQKCCRNYRYIHCKVREKPFC